MISIEQYLTTPTYENYLKLSLRQRFRVFRIRLDSTVEGLDGVRRKRRIVYAALQLLLWEKPNQTPCACAPVEKRPFIGIDTSQEFEYFYCGPLSLAIHID
jgi:hypothetical protein